MRTLVLCLSVALSGCFVNNASTQKKLGETVRDANNAAHWGRVGQAALSVHPKYRAQFVARRADWGGEVQLAEHEVVHIQSDDEGKTTIAMVNCSWYGLSDMSLHSTVIQQTWEEEEGYFSLVEEHVVRGDPSLLLDVEPPPDAKKPENASSEPTEVSLKTN